jgi:hypothetical protein
MYIHVYIVNLIKTSKPVSTGTKKYGQFRGVANFLRLSLRRNVQQGLKKSADIQRGLVF